MRYFLPIFSIIFCFNFALSQVELVLETDQYHHNLHDFLYNTQSNLNGEFQQTDEKIFLRINSQEMVYVDEENQQLSLAFELSNSYIHKQINAFDLGVYYIAHNNDTLKICMIDNNLINHEFISHDHNMSMWSSNNRFFFQKIEDNLFYYIKNNRQRFFKFNTETKETTELVNYFNNNDIEIHHYGNEGIFYSSTYNQNKTLYYINSSGEIEQFYESGNPIESVSWIENNDPDNFYISFKYENNVDSVFRYDYNNLERSFFSTSTFRSLYFKGNRVLGESFYSATFLGNLDNDTLQIIHNPIPISTMYPTFSNSYYGPRLLDFEKEIYTYSTKDHGFEIFKINDDDSLDIFIDLNKERGHGIPLAGCYQINSPPDRIIKNDGKTYLNMTNGNDPNVYLYEITNDSLESVFKLKDYNPGRIRYFTYNDYLYYFVFHSESGNNRLYRIKWDQMNDSQPSSISFDTETWSTETSYIGVNQLCQSQGGNNITPLEISQDSNNNIYVSQMFRNNLNKYLGFDRRNKSEFIDSLSNAYLKYNPKGKLEWVNSIGEKYKSFFSLFDKFVIDNENNLQVYGVFHKKGFFDGESLETDGSARYYAKLDGETGAVLEKKVLYETDYIDDVRFDQLIKGEDNYFYLAGSYRNFNQNFGDTSLISNWNYQNFIAKYDDNGNLVWVRNILNNWNDFIGEVNNIEYIEQTDEIVVFCSQNRTWCNDGTWRADLIFYDTHGNEKIRKDFRGYNRHSISKVTSLDKQYFLIKGSINESISVGVYEFSNQNDVECSKAYDYQIIYDRNQNKFISATISDSLSAINIKRVIKENEYIYYLGNRINGGNIVIQRFLSDGTYKGEKILNQSANLNLFEISYQDGFFVLAMRDAEPDSFLNVKPVFKDVSNVLNIARFQITDWDYLQTYSPMGVKFVEEDVNLFAYPNPTINVVQINFTNENNVFKNYRVVSISGQILFQDNVPDQNFVHIDLSNYENGLYFIQFEGGGKREVVKVIKQP